jgi:carbon monoxide dehydrogenase subunit G
MQFENTFDVDAPIDEVYAALLDVERVAPCVPGAEVLEQTGDDAYKVGIKVKVGPMTMQYKGDVEVVEQDPAAHRAVLRTKMREARGQGTANADVVVTLASEDAARTHGTIATEVQMSGRVASMGRGIIQDVSGRIIDQFSANLAEMLGGGAAAEPAAEAPQATEPQTVPAAEAPQAATAEPASAQASPPPPPPPHAGRPTPPPPPPRKAPAADAELSAAGLAGAVIAGRLKDPKVLAGALAGTFVLGYLIGRR